MSLRSSTSTPEEIIFPLPAGAVGYCRPGSPENAE